MTNREKLNSMTDEELSKLFCQEFFEALVDKVDEPCDLCPFTKLCKWGKSGFLTWLNQEAKDE